MGQSRKKIRRLMIAVNKIDGLYYYAARKLGIKENTLSLLYALSDGREHSQKGICEDWLIPRTTINTVVKECVDAGYVVLTPLGNKEKSVCLTEKGQAFADSILRDVMTAEADAMAETKEEFTDEFVAAFEQFAQNLQEAMTASLDAREPNGTNNFDAAKTEFLKNKLTIRQITEKSEDAEKVKALYKHAFPKNERKPFWNMLSNQSLDMEWLAFYDNEQFCGFACLLDCDSISHILYLAIDHRLRDRGYGSAALAAIHEHRAGKRVIVDIEREGKKADNNEQRLRRKKFYLRNGYSETQIRYRWKHEDYEILSYGGNVTEQEFDLFWKHIEANQA